MDIIETLQYFFKKKNAKTNGGDNTAEIGCVYHHRCNSDRRDSSTSTHDLSTYVWHTEGDGVGLSSSIAADEEDCCSCGGRKRCSFGGRSQQSRRANEGQGSVCDASTSTFDLSTYVWGTQGDMYTTDSRLDEDMEDDAFARDLGDMDSGGKSWGEVGKKRPRAAPARGISICSNSDDLAAPPRKKKRIKKA